MRIARTWASGNAYHLISRFTEGRWFITDDEDRAVYLRLLGAALRDTDWSCIGYALMSNHIHLAVIGGTRPLGTWLRRVHPPFGLHINQRLQRIGPVFAARPSLHAVRENAVGDLLGYIHNNPVRAGVVTSAEQSTWTSARAYLGLVEAPPWLARERAFAFTSRGEDDFACVLSGTIATPDQAALAGLYQRARRAGGVFLGTPTQAPTTAPVLAHPHARVRPDPRHVVRVAASMLGIAVLALCGRRRAPELVRARRMIVHAGLLLGLTATETGDALGVSRQTASRYGLTALTDAELVLVGRVVQAAHVESGLAVVHPPSAPR